MYRWLQRLQLVRCSPIISFSKQQRFPISILKTWLGPRQNGLHQKLGVSLYPEYVLARTVKIFYHLFQFTPQLARFGVNIEVICTGAWSPVLVHESSAQSRVIMQSNNNNNRLRNSMGDVAVILTVCRITGCTRPNISTRGHSPEAHLF